MNQMALQGPTVKMPVFTYEDLQWRPPTTSIHAQWSQRTAVAFHFSSSTVEPEAHSLHKRTYAFEVPEEVTEPFAEELNLKHLLFAVAAAVTATDLLSAVKMPLEQAVEGLHALPIIASHIEPALHGTAHALLLATGLSLTSKPIRQWMAANAGILAAVAMTTFAGMQDNNAMIDSGIMALNMPVPATSTLEPPAAMPPERYNPLRPKYKIGGTA